MFAGLKNQLELQGSLITNILSQDNELVKLKKVLNWKDIKLGQKDVWFKQILKSSKCV